MKSGFHWFILFQNWISTQSHIILGNTNAIFIVTFRGQEGFLAKYLVVLTSEDQPNIEVIHYIISIQNITYILIWQFDFRANNWFWRTASCWLTKEIYRWTHLCKFSIIIKFTDKIGKYLTIFGKYMKSSLYIKSTNTTWKYSLPRIWVGQVVRELRGSYVQNMSPNLHSWSL